MIVRLAQFAQAIKIATDERFFFWPRPALQLCLAPACFGKCRTNFYSKKRGRWIECGRPASLARDVVIKTLLQINRCSNVEYAGSQTQEIDDARAPRQARGHSTRFRD